MLNRKICTLCILMLSVLCFSGCNNQNKTGTSEDISQKVLIDNLEDCNIVASIYYDRHTLKGIESKTYFWKDKKIIDLLLEDACFRKAISQKRYHYFWQ